MVVFFLFSDKKVDKVAESLKIRNSYLLSAQVFDRHVFGGPTTRTSGVISFQFRPFTHLDGSESVAMVKPRNQI